jgi:hypothetical protein
LYHILFELVFVAAEAAVARFFVIFFLTLVGRIAGSSSGVSSAPSVIGRTVATAECAAGSRTGAVRIQ